MSTATSAHGEYGERMDLAHYRLSNDVERLVFARRVRGTVRVMDQIVGECLSDRRHLVASGLHQRGELKRAVIDWLDGQDVEVLWTSELLA